MRGVPIMDEGSVDVGVAWHYGDPMREQREFARGDSRVDLSHFDVITVTGADRVSWLHTLTTQEINDSTVSAQTLVLSPHGHVEFDLRYINYDGVCWLITEPGTADQLVDYLRSMQFMLRVEVADVSADFGVVGAPGWLDTAAVPVWHSPPQYLAGQPQDYVPVRPASWQVSLQVVPRTDIEAEMDRAPRAGTWAWEAARVMAAVPRLGFETDHKTIPHEVGWIAPAVHLSKGCYRGQETVARVYNLGRPPRRLVQLELDGSTNSLPERGADVVHDGVVVGRLTSVTQHYEHGPLGLAVIKRSVAIDVTLEVAGVTASQTPVVV